jgi:uncharacterized protein YecT (DUF1311 family)
MGDNEMAMKADVRLVFFLVMCASMSVAKLAHAATPPVNCKKASTVVERTICASPEFVAMDREIAALYDRALAGLSIDDRHRLAQDQLAFLKRRAGCAWAAHHSAHPGTAINECIRDKMETRVRALRNAVDHGGFGNR